MRSLWSGAIGFGLVNIPVKLFSATKASELDLDMLDKSDLSNIRFRRVNEKTGREVDWENIVKGYKYNEHYIVLSQKDFELANSKKAKMIELSSFISEDEINSVYYETPYYLEPEKNGERAYALLREALLKTHKVGVASFVMRNKESLVIIKPMDNVIVLNRLRFYEEIRPTNEFSLPSKKDVKSAEVQMAVNLINQLSSKFDIKDYKDTYTAELLKLIKAKAKGQKIKTPQLRVVHSRSQDLMQQLKESLTKKYKRAS